LEIHSNFGDQVRDLVEFVGPLIKFGQGLRL